jgi:general secretion pathway protein H
LLEVLVVMTIVGLVMAAVPGFLGAGKDEMAFRTATRELVNTLRRAQAQAIAKNAEVGFWLDVARRAYSLDDGAAVQSLPERTSVTMYSAQEEQIGEAIGRIVFMPDGGATGGRIHLRRGSQQATIHVNWLTGHVTTAP